MIPTNETESTPFTTSSFVESATNITLGVTKRETRSTLPFPVSGDSDDAIKRAVDQFRNKINGPSENTGQPEIPELTESIKGNFESFHRELKRAKPLNLPGQTYRGRLKLHPLLLNSAVSRNIELNQAYYFCRT